MLLATATENSTSVEGNVSQESTAIVDTVLEALPRVGIAVAVVLVAWGIALLVRRVVRTRLTASRDADAGRVFSRLAHALVLTVGWALAITVVFPSVDPVDLFAGLGVFSIAIGFAFQDILSNLLAGILLLLRRPFESGDQIEVSGQRGTVQQITIRETEIRTFDGEKIVVPNAQVYQSVIRVQTAYGPKRTSVSIGLDDHEDLDRAARVIGEAMAAVDGVVADPAPQVLFTGFGEATTDLEARWWTDNPQATVRVVQDRVVRAIGAALKDSGIGMPSPIRELDVRDSFVEAITGAGRGGAAGRPAASADEG